jgi:hypothetical protein
MCGYSLPGSMKVQPSLPMPISAPARVMAQKVGVSTRI